MDVVVVLPTFNEVASLESVVTRIVEGGFCALVVDDGSPDGTGHLADQLARRLAGVSVVHRAAKEGLGPALAAGFAAAHRAGASIIVQMDADGSHDPSELPELVGAIDGGAGMVIGSRYIQGGSSDGLSFSRSLLSRGGNVYARLALGLSVKDATSGFRAYRPAVLKALQPATATAHGYGFQIEMTWRAHELGIQIDEVPITFRPREHGSSKMGIAIPTEAAVLVAGWGLRRLLGNVRSAPAPPATAASDPPAATQGSATHDR